VHRHSRWCSARLPAVVGVTQDKDVWMMAGIGFEGYGSHLVSHKLEKTTNRFTNNCGTKMPNVHRLCDVWRRKVDSNHLGIRRRRQHTRSHNPRNLGRDKTPRDCDVDKATGGLCTLDQSVGRGKTCHNLGRHLHWALRGWATELQSVKRRGEGWRGSIGAARRDVLASDPFKGLIASKTCVKAEKIVKKTMKMVKQTKE
jgi:hypothetical protein